MEIHNKFRTFFPIKVELESGWKLVAVAVLNQCVDYVKYMHGR